MSQYIFCRKIKLKISIILITLQFNFFPGSAMKFKEVLVIVFFLFVIFVQSNPTPRCGKKNGVQGSVFGGESTKPNTWPWLVAFLHRKKLKNTFFCGGSLVSVKHVVSGMKN